MILDSVAYSKKIDIWSSGVVLRECTEKDPPYFKETVFRYIECGSHKHKGWSTPKAHLSWHAPAIGCRGRRVKSDSNFIIDADHRHFLSSCVVTLAQNVKMSASIMKF